MTIFDVNSGLCVENGTVILPQGTSVNKIVVNPLTEHGDVDFCTVGQNGHFEIWKYDASGYQVLNIKPDMN